RRDAGERSDAGAQGAAEEWARRRGDSSSHDERAADDHLPALLGHRTGRYARDGIQGSGQRAGQARRRVTADGRLLFATRFLRLFAYGALSVVLVLYLVELGLTETDTGLLLTSTLLGDTLVSLYLTTQADRIGRRRMLIIGAVLMSAAGIAFAFTNRMW